MKKLHANKTFVHQNHLKVEKYTKSKKFQHETYVIMLSYGSV